MLDRERGERAADPGQCSGNDQLEMDQPIDRDAEKLEPDLALAHRHGKRACDRVEIERDHQRGERAPSEHEPEQGERFRPAVQPGAQKRRGLNVKTVSRAERLGLHQHAIEDHRHGEAEHREEDIAVAREQKPDQIGEDPRHQRRRNDERNGIAQVGEAAEQRHRVSAGRIEQRLAERHQTGAPQDHEPEHHQRVGERNRGERHQP